MKYIKVLPAVDLVSLRGDKLLDDKGNPATFDFSSFVLQRLEDPKFGKSMEAIVSVFQIRQAVADADTYLALETKDWELLKDVIKEPSPQTCYNPAVAHCIVPFMKAVMEAKDNKPE